MYVRYEDRRTGEGLFQALRRLKPRRAWADRYDELHGWLWVETPNVPSETYDRPRWCRLLATWWQPGARVHHDKAWEACGLLRAHGHAMRRITTSTLLGTRLYEDDLQLVVRHDRAELIRLRHEQMAHGAGDRATIRRWSP